MWRPGQKAKFLSQMLHNVDWSADANEDITIIKAVGDNGTVTINTLFGFSNNFTRDNIEIIYKGENGESEKVVYPINNTFALDAFKDMVRYFIDAINGQATEILQPFYGVNVVDVIERLYESV
jgi:hypothetical protein